MDSRFITNLVLKKFYIYYQLSVEKIKGGDWDRGRIGGGLYNCNPGIYVVNIVSGLEVHSIKMCQYMKCA